MGWTWATSRRKAAILGGILSMVAAAPASAACPVAKTTKAFSVLGDSADYTLAPGGNFEGSTSGWSLGTAKVTSGNESYFVGSRTDTRSLAVPATTRVVSPVFCVGVEHPTFRFFARRTSGVWGSLLVKLRWTDSVGRVNETTVGSVDGGALSKWGASASLKLATTLPLTASGQSINAQVVFDPEDFGGAWQVDDLYIDPYRRS